MSRLCTSLVWSCFLLGVLEYDIMWKRKNFFATNCTVKRNSAMKTGLFCLHRSFIIFGIFEEYRDKGAHWTVCMGFTTCYNIDSTGTKG